MIRKEDTTVETSVLEIDGELYRVTRLWGKPLAGSMCPQLLAQASGYLSHKEMFSYFTEINDKK